MAGLSRDDGSAAQSGSQSTDELLAVLYHELRRLAAAKLANETPGQTLQPTALVHEAYLRLLGSDRQTWQNEGHFFAAAAEAMRRILVDNARRKHALRAGGDRQRLDFEAVDFIGAIAERDLLTLEEALTDLERHDQEAASLVTLRFFAGLSHRQAAEALGISRRNADRIWKIARAWLQTRLTGSS